MEGRCGLRSVLRAASCGLRESFAARTLLSALVAIFLMGCAEKQETGGLCPALCPSQNIPTKDTTLEASFVTTLNVAPFPTIGSEGVLLLASRGDSLDARAVIRFDSLPHRRPVAVGDTTTAPITDLDSASIRLRLDASGTRVTAPVTVELFNVDTSAADTNTAAVAALFRPDRLVGSATFEPTALLDTLLIPIDTAFLRGRVQGQQRVRLGLRVTSTASAQLRVWSSASFDLGPRIFFDPSFDAFTPTGSYRVLSLTPTDNEALVRDLADYTLILNDTDEAAGGIPGLLQIGGLPARRGYLRFDLPKHIVDSSTVVRATLTLTQSPNSRLDATDSVTLYATPSLARGVISEPVRVAMLTGRVADSARVTAASTGTIDLELVQLLRRWRGIDPTEQPRVVILSTSMEGASPLELRVYDASAAPGLRPRLRITYVPRVDFGLP
jgi:hypothetical protein